MKQIMEVLSISFTDLSPTASFNEPTASFKSYDNEIRIDLGSTSASTASGSKSQADDVQGKTLLYNTFVGFQSVLNLKNLR